MTDIEFDHTWFNLVATNSTWNKAAINEKTIKMYRIRLIQYPVKIFEDAIKLLQNDKTDRLPSVGDFIKYCRMVEEEYPSPQKKVCPCCCDTGYLVFNWSDGTTRAFKCDCHTNEDSDNKTLKYSDRQLNKCESLTCQNPGKRTVVKVPQHSYWHFKKTLSKCDSRPSIQETKESYYERNEKQILDKTGIEIKGVGD